MKIIDDFLNNITMYRLVLYYLIALLTVAGLLSFFGSLPYSIFAILFSVIFLVAVSWVTNRIFASVFAVPANIESVYITALILALIVAPPASLGSFVFLFWAAVLAQASKYILAIRKKHLFNPAAFAVVLTALTISQSANWWVGTSAMMPFVLIGGLLVIRKIRREDLVVSFFLAAISVVTAFSLVNQTNLFSSLKTLVLTTPLFFLGFVMLTEPATTPPTKKLQIFYGGLIGFLFPPQVHFGGIYLTPELALLIGNVFSYWVSPKEKLVLRLKEKLQIAPEIYDYVFDGGKRLAFPPGQYLEWTLGHKNPDDRGIRRYFTIASSPTEGNLRFGIKFPPNLSSFKKNLLKMETGSQIFVGQLAGDFTLPNDPRQKLVFIGGGIGVTPFRSILKYLLDKGEKRNIILFYSEKRISDFVYTDIFNQAGQLGIKTIYFLTDINSVPVNWAGKVGRIDAAVIYGEVPDFAGRTFYLSGPQMMVTALEETLQKMGVKKNRIITDYFPGYA